MSGGGHNSPRRTISPDVWSCGPSRAKKVIFSLLGGAIYPLLRGKGSLNEKGRLKEKDCLESARVDTHVRTSRL